MRKPIIVGNWKMNLDLEDARRLIVEIRQGLRDIDERKIDIVVCPAFVHLQSVNFQLPVNIKLGAQDVFWKKGGAYTGEISPDMLKDVGCRYVIIGHSERRQLGETDEMINKKISTLLDRDLFPILCLGETKEEKEKNLGDSKIKEQVIKDLEGIKTQVVEKVIIAYEPVWAIGTGKAAKGEEVNKTAKLIRKVIEGRYSKNQADKIRILYGGSVDQRNVKEFVNQSQIDGVLVGETSLKANKFIKIVEQVIE